VDTSPAPALKADPQWDAAAQLLVDGCAHAPDAAYGVDVLERLCLALGDQLYPAFLNVLCVVSERGTPAAQVAVAEALVDSLRSCRLPAGRRAAWGAGSDVGRAVPAGLPDGPNLPSGQRPRSVLGAALGPVEYLCVWYAEPNGVDAPSASSFHRTLLALLRLVSHSDRARTLYAARLRALADDPLVGTLSRRARQALHALATAWQQAGASPAAAVDAALQALGGTGLRALGPATGR
jgi:hypothetical protein